MNKDKVVSYILAGFALLFSFSTWHYFSIAREYQDPTKWTNHAADITALIMADLEKASPEKKAEIEKEVKTCAAERLASGFAAVCKPYEPEQNAESNIQNQCDGQFVYFMAQLVQTYCRG